MNDWMTNLMTPHTATTLPFGRLLRAYLPRALATALALLATVACGGGAEATPPGTAYTPPAVATEGDGAETYVEAPMIDAAAAQGLNPIPDSPEAAAVKFLASRVRGDAAWKEAMTADLSDRGKRGLEAWEEWKLERFQLRKRQPSGSNSYWITVYFEISIDGDTDDGTDEIGVSREGDGWRVFEVPS